MVTITPLKQTAGSYDEVSPIMGRYSFSFVDDNLEQICRFSKCREALAEQFMRRINNSPGYEKYLKPSLEKTKLLVAYTDNSALEKELTLAIDCLNQIEHELGLVKTKMDTVEGMPQPLGRVFYIEGSKRWQLSPPMLSLFMLILRSGGEHKKSYMETLKRIEGNGYPIITKAVEYLIAKKYWKVFDKDQLENWPCDNDRAGLTPFLGISLFMTARSSSHHNPDYYPRNYPTWKFPQE